MGNSKSERESRQCPCCPPCLFLRGREFSRGPQSPDGQRKDFYTLTEKGLDLIPIVLNIVLWSAKHDSKSYVRRSKDFAARLSQNPMQVSEEIKALVRNGGCLFPDGKE